MQHWTPRWSVCRTRCIAAGRSVDEKQTVLPSAGVVVRKFSSFCRESVKRTSEPKRHQKSQASSVLSNPKFAKEPAAKCRELRIRDTSSQLHACPGSRFRSRSRGGARRQLFQLVELHCTRCPGGLHQTDRHQGRLRYLRCQ